jgi:hypothetical protein
MSISQNFPNTRPSLSINFARSQRLDPRITFTRTTSGTRVGSDGYIEVIPADQPRFDFDPVTGECLGLLIEEQRENLWNNSNDFTVWTKQTTSPGVVGVATTTSTVSPDGTLNAYKYFIQTSGGSFYSLYRGVSNIVANSSYTYSLFAKAGEITNIGLVVFDGTSGSGCGFNLSTGQPGTPYTSANTTFGNIIMKNYGNGWYRCELSFSHSVGGSAFQFKIDLSGTLSENNGVFLYGAQLERSKDASSYIPTSGSTVTRTSDNAFIDGENFSRFFNPNEGTAVITYRPRFNGVYNSPFRPLFAIRNPSGTIMGFTGNSNTGQLYFHSYVALLNGGNFTWLSPPSPSTERTERALVSYANTYFRMYQDERPFVSTNPTYGAGKIEDFIPSSVGISTLGFNALVFGGSSASNETTKFNHIVQQFVYYPSEVGITNAKTLSKRP